MDGRRLTAAYLPVGPGFSGSLPIAGSRLPKAPGLGATPHADRRTRLDRQGSSRLGRLAKASARGGTSCNSKWQRGIADSGRRDPRHPSPTPL